MSGTWEECCFYADHSGIVTPNFHEIRKGTEKRKKDLSTSWYNNGLTGSFG